MHVLVGHGDRVVGDERRAARQHLVEDAAERVDVGAMVHGLAASLFGRRGGGSEDGGATGDARPGDPVRDPQVHQLRPTVGLDHHVGRLHIAVDDPRAVCDTQGVGDPGRDRGRAGGRGSTLRPERVGERLARDTLHHEVVDPLLGSRVVHGDEPGMREPRGRQRLTPEPFDERPVAGQPISEDLDRDRSVQDPIGREVDLGHAAAPEELADRIAVGQHPTLDRHTSRLRGGTLRPAKAAAVPAAASAPQQRRPPPEDPEHAGVDLDPGRVGEVVGALVLERARILHDPEPERSATLRPRVAPLGRAAVRVVEVAIRSPSSRWCPSTRNPDIWCSK